MHNRNHRVTWTAPALLLLASSCCGSDDAGHTVDSHGSNDSVMECDGLEPRGEDEVVFCNEFNEAILAPVSLPAGPPPAAGWPAVVVLHGSGGLFAGGDDCTEGINDQYQIWADALNKRGYAVVMPSSFFSRGFCEWDDHPDELDDIDRLVFRVYDAAAASHWLCDDPRFDCARIAVMGFSNGASATLMLLHEDLRDADDPRFHALAELPPLVGGVAYYPGCGLEGELANKLDTDQRDRYYYPRAPVWVPHAEEDKMADTCEELRDPQVDVISDQRGVAEDMFDLEVYDDAKHAFDESDEGEDDADYDARLKAQARTLDKLAQWL